MTYSPVALAMGGGKKRLESGTPSNHRNVACYDDSYHTNYSLSGV